MNIRVDLTTPIKDGTEVVFRSPVDCSQITGLIVYVSENGITSSQEFALADAHGNNVGDIDHLFAENVVVKVILDVTHGMAFVQNADTNAYLEGRFADIFDKLCPPINETGLLVQCSPVEGSVLSVTGMFEGALEVSSCGKNLYDASEYPLVDGFYINKGNGVEVGNGSHAEYCATIEYIPVAHLRGMKINLNHIPGGSAPGMAFYDANKVRTDVSLNGKGNDQMVPFEATYMRFCTYISKKKEVQIELGSVATDYEPYVDSGGFAADDDALPVVMEAHKGVNTIWAIDQGNGDVPVNITVTGKADPVALIDRLMQAVFPATISNEEV